MESAIRSCAKGQARFSPQQENKLARKIEGDAEREMERWRVMEKRGQKRG